MHVKLGCLSKCQINERQRRLIAKLAQRHPNALLTIGNILRLTGTCSPLFNSKKPVLVGVLLLGAELQVAVNRAEELRNRCQDMSLLVKGQPLSFTLSIGVAVLKDGISHPDELLKRADDALYTVKHQGRNRGEAAV